MKKMIFTLGLLMLSPSAGADSVVTEAFKANGASCATPYGEEDIRFIIKANGDLLYNNSEVDRFLSLPEACILERNVLSCEEIGFSTDLSQYNLDRDLNAYTGEGLLDGDVTMDCRVNWN